MGKISADGIHPTAAAQAMMLDRFWTDVGGSVFGMTWRTRMRLLC